MIYLAFSEKLRKADQRLITQSRSSTCSCFLKGGDIYAAVYVEGNFRNLGIASRLIELCENWAKFKGCKPNEAVMIGDRLDNDIVPAKQLGMKTVWVRQGFAKYQSVTNETEQPDYIIETIDKILNLL